MNDISRLITQLEEENKEKNEAGTQISQNAVRIEQLIKDFGLRDSFEYIINDNAKFVWNPFKLTTNKGSRIFLFIRNKEGKIQEATVFCDCKRSVRLEYGSFLMDFLQHFLKIKDQLLNETKRDNT